MSEDRIPYEKKPVAPDDIPAKMLELQRKHAPLMQELKQAGDSILALSIENHRRRLKEVFGIDMRSEMCAVVLDPLNKPVTLENELSEVTDEIKAAVVDIVHDLKTNQIRLIVKL